MVGMGWGRRILLGGITLLYLLYYQKKKLQEIRAKRDNGAVEIALNAVTDCAADKGGNLLDLAIKVNTYSYIHLHTHIHIHCTLHTHTPYTHNTPHTYTHSTPHHTHHTPHTHTHILHIPYCSPLFFRHPGFDALLGKYLMPLKR